MGNFTLQKGPCSFLKLRISPWGIPPILLLCSPLSWRSSFFFSPAAPLSLSLLFQGLSLPASFPLSLSSVRGALLQAARPQAARALGAEAGRVGSAGA
jgi:hypothetical protein